MATWVPAAVLLLVAAAGCQRGSPAGERTVLRFLDEPAQELLQPGDLLTTREIAAWPVADPGELADWRVTGADKVLKANGSVLVLQGTKSLVTMEREVELEAGGIDTLTLTVGRVRGISIQLDWAPPGQPFDDARQVAVRARDVPSRAAAEVHFPVAEHPLWEGTIGRLRLRYAIPRKRRMFARRLAAVETRVSGERLAAAVASSWLIDVDGDTRGALLAPPGVAIERDLTVPDGARWVAAFAAPRAAGPRVEMRASFVPVDGDGTPRGAPVPLFSRILDPAVARGWQSAEADLGALAGQRGRLRLDSLADGLTADQALAAGALPAAWGNPEVRAPAATTPDPELADPPPNVILISIDTLRADRLSLYGHPVATSPRLDAWASRRAVTFDTAVAAAPWTLPSHTSMFTGLDAFRHGVNFDVAAPPELTTLAERLRGAGYRTLSVNGGGFLHPRFGLAQGFDRTHTYRGDRTRDTRELETGVDRALELLAGPRGGPFFLFFHTYEVHGPMRERAPEFEELHGYRPPVGVSNSAEVPRRDDGYLAEFVLKAIDAEPIGMSPVEPPAGTDLAALAGDLYDARIAYADRQISRLFAALERHGLEDDTVVIVTSDHGEMLGEHGLGGHAYLYDENLLVPLVIAVPGLTDRSGAAPRRVTRQVRQVDIAPTVLELAGLAPDPALDGRSLVPLLSGSAGSELPAEAWSYSPKTLHGVSLRAGNRVKYIQRTGLWSPIAGQGLLFDLRADPREEAPDLGDHSELRQTVRERLREAYSGVLLRAANAAAPRGDGRALQAVLRGTLFSHSAVQSLDRGCDCAELRGVDRLALDLAAGRAITLRLESASDEQIQVAAVVPGVGPRGRASLTLDLGGLDTPAALLWDGRRWTQRQLAASDLGDPEAPYDAALATGLVVWRRGPARTPTARPSEQDAALREQLKALGYID